MCVNRSRRDRRPGRRPFPAGRGIPPRRILTPPTSENARMWTVGAPGPGSGAPSILVPPMRLKPDSSTRMTGETGTRTPPTSDALVKVTSGPDSCGWLRSSRVPLTMLITTTWRSIPPWPVDPQATGWRHVPRRPGGGVAGDSGPGRHGGRGKIRHQAPTGAARRGPPSRHAGSLPCELRDVREPPNLRGLRLDADREAGRPDLGLLCVHGRADGHRRVHPGAYGRKSGQSR